MKSEPCRQLGVSFRGEGVELNDMIRRLEPGRMEAEHHLARTVELLETLRTVEVVLLETLRLRGCELPQQVALGNVVLLDRRWPLSPNGVRRKVGSS